MLRFWYPSLPTGSVHQSCCPSTHSPAHLTDPTQCSVISAITITIMIKNNNNHNDDDTNNSNNKLI